MILTPADQTERRQGFNKYGLIFQDGKTTD